LAFNPLQPGQTKSFGSNFAAASASAPPTSQAFLPPKYGFYKSNHQKINQNSQNHKKRFRKKLPNNGNICKRQISGFHSQLLYHENLHQAEGQDHPSSIQLSVDVQPNHEPLILVPEFPLCQAKDD
jgi:hypothetical protein